MTVLMMIMFELYILISPLLNETLDWCFEEKKVQDSGHATGAGSGSDVVRTWDWGQNATGRGRHRASSCRSWEGITHFEQTVSTLAIRRMSSYTLCCMASVVVVRGFSFTLLFPSLIYNCMRITAHQSLQTVLKGNIQSSCFLWIKRPEVKMTPLI